MAPKAFAPVPNAWGKQGWTTGQLSELDEAELSAPFVWRGLTPAQAGERSS
jgi:hypothetical protein